MAEELLQVVSGSTFESFYKNVLEDYITEENKENKQLCLDEINYMFRKVLKEVDSE